LDHGGAIGGEDASGDFHLMVESRVGEHFKARADGAAFGIVGPVDETRDTRLDDGTRAHAAGLYCDVERGISETIVGKQAGGFAKNDNFGVAGRVTIADSAVARASKDLAVVDEHGADRYFAGCGCGARFDERFLYELDVSFHLPREDNMFHGSLYQLSVWWEDSGEWWLRYLLENP